MDYRKPNGAKDNRPKSPKAIRSFDEYAADIAEAYFKNNFEDILTMSQSKQFDVLLGDIEKFVNEKGSEVSTSQLRNVYDEVIKAKEINELKMIRPHLAYIAGKMKKERAIPFFAFIDMLIKKVDSKEKLDEFQRFFESVVAYHKYYYNKNN